MNVISPRGDYSDRRAEAKRAGALVHLQYHFNSGGGSYALTEITSAADERCRDLARLLVADFAKLFGIKNGGVRILDRGDRGWSCIGNELPGIILEPFFGDSWSQANKARAVQDEMAHIIADRITQLYPSHATIALTLGHKYKTSNPSDRGASLDGGGNEASYMEPVLDATRRMLSDHMSEIHIGRYTWLGWRKVWYAALKGAEETKTPPLNTKLIRKVWAGFWMGIPTHIYIAGPYPSDRINRVLQGCLAGWVKYVKYPVKYKVVTR